jgi:hypothetical protein
MNEFLLVFRMDPAKRSDLQSPEQMQLLMKRWQDWMGSIAAQNKLVSPGNRLGADGKVVKPNKSVTNGPYVELKESIGGYTIVKASSLDEAAEISKGCPVLAVGGNVEIRPVVPMYENA